mmetsp:Transcript_36036/g.56242  ORF Transcript_36036/g.56242 Transcript_36036/m.56242 type:complete len:457 (-) Transcript_36036:703-2073(-)
MQSLQIALILVSAIVLFFLQIRFHSKDSFLFAFQGFSSSSVANTSLFCAQEVLSPTVLGRSLAHYQIPTFLNETPNHDTFVTAQRSRLSQQTFANFSRKAAVAPNRCSNASRLLFIIQRGDGSGSNLLHVVQAIAFANWNGWEYAGQIGNANFRSHGIRTNDIVTFLGVRGVVASSWKSTSAALYGQREKVLAPKGTSNAADMKRILKKAHERSVFSSCRQALFYEGELLNFTYFVEQEKLVSFDKFMPRHLQLRLRKNAEAPIRNLMISRCLFDKSAARLTVAIQLRRGDIHPKARKERYRKRFTPDYKVISLISLIRNFSHDADIHVFSDTTWAPPPGLSLKNYKAVTDTGVRVHLDSPLQSVFSHFITADVLAMDLSLMSLTAAYFKPNGCIIRPPYPNIFYKEVATMWLYLHLSTWAEVPQLETNHTLRCTCFKIESFPDRQCYQRANMLRS